MIEGTCMVICPSLPRKRKKWHAQEVTHTGTPLEHRMH